MKKQLLTSLVAMASVGAFAQGYVTTGMSGSTHPIEYSTDGGVTLTKVPTASPAQVGSYGELNVAVYYNLTTGTAINNLTAPGETTLPDLSQWAVGATIIHNITAVPGNVTAISEDLTSATSGNNVQFEVVGWTGTATSFTAAEANNAGILLGWAGSSLSGGLLGWNQQVGSSSSAKVMNAGTSGFNALVLAPVPEPGTIALGGLGAAALLLFRRRK